jgi:hypothetical protein
MARVITTGFETNDTTYDFETISGTPAIDNSPVRTGSYSLELRSSERVGWNVGTPTKVFVGVAFYLDTTANGTDMVDFFSGSGHLFKVGIGIGGNIVFLRGLSTVVATSSNACSAGGWYYMEIEYYPDQSAGTCTVRINGAEWLTFTGDTQDAAGTFNVVRLVASASTTVNYDDLVINDDTGSDNNTWPGQCRLYLATVNGAGDATDLTASAGNNYECVDETPPSTSDYVYSSTATDRDLYDITDPLAGTETLGSVTIQIVAKLDSGSGNLATTLKAGTTEDDGDDITLTETWTRYEQTWAENPDDSAAWEPADIDDLQIGVEVKA